MDRPLTDLLRREGVLSSAALQRHGVTRSRIARATARGEVVRVLPRVYALVELPPWPDRLTCDEAPVPEHLVHVRAVLQALGPGACAAGRTAAVLRGWGVLHEPRGVVEVLVPHGRSRERVRVARAGVRRRRDLSPVLLAPGLPSLDAVATVLDCCRTRPLREAVVVLDSALRAGAVGLAQVEQAAGRLPGTARRRVLRAVAQADPASGSVLESVLRVLLLRAGLEGWETQVVLRRRDGTHLLRADFCWPAARLVVEVDGRRWHADAARDRARDNDLAAHGWRVLRFGWRDVVHEPDRVLGLLRAALLPVDTAA